MASQIHDVRRAVLAALLAEPQVSTGQIDVSAQAGVVTLSGYAASCGQRDVARRSARRAGSVNEVINTVLIALPSRPDARLALG